MKFRPLFALAIVAFNAAPAFADEAVERHGRPQPSAEEKAKWDAMTPDQRKAAMAERRAAREASMTPEQKARHEARRKEWEAMTPEQREAKRQEMDARRGQHPRRQRQQ